MKETFPIIKAGHIFNKFPLKDKISCNLSLNEVEINYPCRLDAMAINPAAVVYNSDMVFTPGEVVVSIKQFIKVKIKVLSDTGGKLNITSSTKRKVLVKHSYLLMCDALNVMPSLEIDVNDDNIPKHCGFGSSSSTITAVAAAINELYNCPISNPDLIKYLASNHGEEINDSDCNNLKVVQCIGGGATNGLTEEGIIIIAGKATTIAKMKYESEVLICIPKDFVPKDAKLLMELEEKNLWKFKKTGDMYAEKIAYDLLHKALPGMANGSIKELSDVVFDYRFNMGSNENCSFVYDGLAEIGTQLRKLYENNNCDFLALSSVGPAYFAMVSDSEQKKICINKMEELNMNVVCSSICNTKYSVLSTNKRNVYWEKETTKKEFTNKPPSKYITDNIDKIIDSNFKCIDIGCGGGRYANYLRDKNCIVMAIDKYPEMAKHSLKDGITFKKGLMDNIPVNDECYNLALSIGVIHNAINIDEYQNAIKEVYRVLEKKGFAILSVFTNDILTDDLKEYNANSYYVKDRLPMMLFDKSKINEFVLNAGFELVKIIDEHITDVGSGKRNVYTILLKK